MTLATLDQQHRPGELVDFRVKTTLWTAGAAGLFLGPISVNNLVQGATLLGAGGLLIVALFAVIAHVANQGRLSDLSLILFPPVLAFLLVSLKEQGVIGVMWSYPCIVSFYFLFRERWAWVTNALLIMTIVPLAANELETAVALRAMVTLNIVSGFSILAIRVITVQQERLERMAVTDPLTGVLNRSLLTPNLEQAFARNRRSAEPTSLLILDIDHFKEINDTYGHLAGDAALVRFAELLTNRLRTTDQIFRIGGEEFAILLPDTASEPARHVGQLIRSAVAGETLLDGHPVTVSVGAASLRKDDTVETWLGRADRCLYDAKRSGRNLVVSDSSAPKLS